ncbi:MAG: LLM class flavin-dependent oxidoreductase [Acidimicrobiia bacterium]|nr:LLM class flavin-dependent oxidoreductase [Acidimicrobiia bacterium]
MPSLLVVSGALAAVTSTIQIGTGVVLAPLHHPLRLAEDAATASLLSGGRLTLGLGLGWMGVEFEGLGADTRKRGRAMEEILGILPQAWSGEPFHHQGDVYRFPELAVRPVPSVPITVLVGGGAEPAIRRAARLADGIFSNATADRFLDQVGWVRDECERIGRDPAELQIHHYSVLLPGSSADEAWDHYAEHVWQMQWKYSDMEVSATRSGTPPTAPELTDDRRSKLRARSTFAGTGEEIVASLLEIKERAAVPVHFSARSYFPDLHYDDQFELMQQLAEGSRPAPVGNQSPTRQCRTLGRI